MPRKTNFTTGNNSYFRTTATIGKNPDGKPIRKQFYGSSKKEAEQKRDEYVAGLKEGLAVDYDKATFGTAFKHWLENVKRHAITVTTYDKYSRLHRLYIAGCGLAGIRLVDVKAANVQAYYNALMDSTTANNIHEIHKLLKTFFGYCLKSDSLVRSPLLAVELPKTQTQPERNTALPDTDIGKLVQACQKDMKHFPFLFLCFSGLREGELLALTYKDLDLKEDMISVNKAVKQLTVDGEFQTKLQTFGVLAPHLLFDIGAHGRVALGGFPAHGSRRYKHDCESLQPYFRQRQEKRDQASGRLFQAGVALTHPKATLTHILALKFSIDT